MRPPAPNAPTPVGAIEPVLEGGGNIMPPAPGIGGAPPGIMPLPAPGLPSAGIPVEVLLGMELPPPGGPAAGPLGAEFAAGAAEGA